MTNKTHLNITISTHVKIINKNLFSKQKQYIIHRVHGLGIEVLHPPPMTLQEWYQFVHRNDTNQNRRVPINLLGCTMPYGCFSKWPPSQNDENNEYVVF